jgi:extracellular elastinolytic metalloproteinase
MPGNPGRTRLASAARRHAVILAAVAAAALAVPSAGLAVVQIADVHEGGLAPLDTRTARVAPTAAQLRAVARLGADARWNRFGTPASLLRHGGALGAPVAGADAAAAARAWLATHKQLFRLSSVEGLELVGQTSLTGSDGHAVVFRQAFGGVEASPDGVVTVGIVGAPGSGWRVVYVASSLTGDEVVTGSVELSGAEAWVDAAAAVGEDVSVVEVRPRGTEAGWTRLQVTGFEEPQYVRRVAFPTPRRGVVAAYETQVAASEAGALEAYLQVVDAATGAVLLRENMIDHAVDDPRWKVFPAYPLLGHRHFPWNIPSTDIRQIWCWLGRAAEGCQRVLAGESPHPSRPYDTDGATGAPTSTTVGNNAMAQENWQDPINPTLSGYRPVSPTREYVYPWRNTWFERLCDPASFVPGAEPDLPTAIVNLFVGHNRQHDWSYFLGFTEATWNAQRWNFGINTAGENDPIIGDAQAGGVVGGYPSYTGRNNANMFTRPDGQSSWSNMYMWQPLAGSFYAPCVDGDFDMSVIGHEYGHMIENRMIGKGNRRFGFHAGAMGESFGDLNGMEYLVEWGFVPVSGENPYAVGPYVTGNEYRGIRNYGMNFAPFGDVPSPGEYPVVNPLNFGDIGYDLTGPQVHADGEIWSATNFDIRRLFIQRYGGERAQACAAGRLPPERCPGNRRWFQLYYDAMLLMPTRPTMLDARDAILAADAVRFDGRNEDLLWLGFARRGFGESAFTASEEDRQPKPAFDSPLHREERVRFRALDKTTGAPVVANVYVGHYEGRVSPIADTNPATGPADGSAPADASNLDNVASFVPRTYEFVANAPGYGHVRFRATFSAGDSRTITIRFAPNWASRFKGATAAGDGTRQDSLIDDTEASNWEATGAPVQGRQVTVALGGGAHALARAAVSAHLVPTVDPQEVTQATQNRFTALRQFELRGCVASAHPANPACEGTNPAGWSVLYRSRPDFFPGDTPRPVAPELVLRDFGLDGGRRYTHVQLVVLHNQCTGQPAYQGEQDSDPANATDCRIGTLPALPSRANDVRAAELQVFAERHSVSGAQLAGGGGRPRDDD